MAEVLTGLAGLSVGSSVVIAALLLAARLTGRRYAARWRCWIWALLCLRLAVPLPLVPAAASRNAPVRLPAPQNPVVYQAGPPAAQTRPPATLPVQGTPASAPPRPVPSASPAHPAAGEGRGISFSLSQVLLGLWLGGAAAVLAWNAAAHIRFLRWLRRWAAPVGDPVLHARCRDWGERMGLRRLPRLLSCPGLDVPMLAGLLRSALLLPRRGMDGGALDYALLHELVHCRRRDIWLKTLVLWVNALYWFNPLVWLMVRAVERDTELACDEGALALLPGEEHASYGRAVLAAAAALGKEEIS